jgi:hypothetical protein
MRQVALAQQLRSQDKQPSGHEHNYAGTISGPVWLPKIYNGKDKLFFFFSYNGFKDARSEEPNNINRTVPTLANRAGDFSQLLSVDAVCYQIYDPLSVHPDSVRASHFIRTPFPGNIIPKSRFNNPSYNAYVKLLPTPHNDPTNPKLEPVRNYVAVATPLNFQYEAYANRIDYNRSEKHRFFGRWSWNDYIEDRGDWTYETVRGLNVSGLSRHNIGATVDWVHTLGPETVLDVAIAGNEYKDGNKFTFPFRFKPSDVGLPKYLDDKAADQHILPTMSFSGYETLGRNVPSFTRSRMLTARADISHVRGKHTVRAGFDERQHFRTGGGCGNTSGLFSFTNTYTRRNDDTFTPAGDLGLSWASFILGIPSGISVATNDTYAIHTPYYAAYVQDNWRLTPKLSLNLGLRMEYEMGATERYNRMIGWFDPTAKLPITDIAQAAYARNPVPELSADKWVLDASIYAGVNGASRRIWRNALMWLPRFAGAYELNRTTVVRGGYGIFYDTLNALNEAIDQTGFSRTTSPVITNHFGTTWLVGDPAKGVSPLSDPFPVRSDGTRFDTPLRDALSVMANAGRGFTFTDFDRKHARQQRWRIGVQRQLTAGMMVELAYAGSLSDNVSIAQVLSYLPEQYWADGQVRNDAIANNLNANVTNPFYIQNFAALRTSDPVLYQDMSTNSFFTSPIIRKERRLRAFPEMNNLTNNTTPNGKVRTDELHATFERRFSRGLLVNFGYTRLRSNSYTYYREFDAAPTWRSTFAGRPHRVVGTAVYELPFGKGRAFARQGVPNLLFGGFQISATYEWQPGPLLTWGNFFYSRDPTNVKNVDRDLDHWFNTGGFERNASKGPAAFHKRVFPDYIDGLRADMTNQWNVNSQREFKITERVAQQVRFDAINLQNRSQFDVPNQNAYSTDFGRVMQQSSALNSGCCRSTGEFGSEARERNET